MALPETALGSVPPSEGMTLEQPAGASGTRLKVAARPATVGATWMDLFHPGTPSPPSLDARVRVVADIAGALIQIHDNTGLPRPHRRHGRLTPRHLLIGVDGSASLFTAREPFSKLLPPQPDLGYLAPELLTQSGPATQQSDVFSLGALLWEALDNGRLFPHRRAAAISRLIARRSLPGPRIEEEWALPLGDVAMKALSQNPDDRYLDATAFWLALREHLPPPDGARQVLSRLAQRALKLELTTDIRDEPPYLAPRVLGMGSLPPSRSSFDDEPEPEAPARYSLHPEPSSRHISRSQAPPDDPAWALSDPPPRPSMIGADPSTLALATQLRRSRPPAAKPAPPSEPPRTPRTSAPPSTPRAHYSQPPSRAEGDPPISTLHVNLPRELIDGSLPFYVSGPPASRAFPWGPLIFAALVFFGVGAAVAFGAVTALRAPNATTESARTGGPIAPVATPATPTPVVPTPPPVATAPSSPASPAASPSPSAAAPEALLSPAPPLGAAGTTPTTASTSDSNPSQPTIPAGTPTADAVADGPTPAAAKAPEPAHKPARRARTAKAKRSKPLPVVAAEEPAPEPPPSTEIIREMPGDEPPNAGASPNEDIGETPSTEQAPADLPFVDQPY
jgi:hypothetical protein